MNSVFENIFTPLISSCSLNFPVEDSKHLYRVEGNDAKLYAYDYKILRRTEKGVWINYYGEEKFVLLTARKKFACETQEAALVSFIARKNRQIKILSAQLNNAKEILRLAHKIHEEQGK